MSHTFLRSTRVLPLVGLLALAACSIDAPTGPMAGNALSARKPPKPGITHDPILFVHGWNATSSTWTTMISRFKTDKWTSGELVNWSYDFRQSNATTAAQIAAKWGTPRYATWWSPCDEDPAANEHDPRRRYEYSTSCMQHSQLHENATVYSQVKAWMQ